MVICFFAAQYMPSFGGVERFTYELSKQAVHNGDRVIVVTSQWEDCPAQETTAEGIEVIRLPAHAFMDGRFPVTIPNKTFRRLTKWLWAQPIDAVVIQTRLYTSCIYAAVATRLHHVPAIVVEHGSGHVYPSGALASFFGHLYEHVFARFVYLFCPRFYGVSSEAASWLSHFHIKASGVLRNAVNLNDIDHFLTEQADLSWRARMNLPTDAKIVLFVGRLIREKGIYELLDGFSAMDAPSDTHLLIVGDGPLADTLAPCQSDTVHFLGRLPHRELMPLYQQCDVYCFPSYSEGFPTSVLEAGACGAAVITSNVGGASEIIDSPDYGYMLPEVSADAIREALTVMLLDDERRARCGENLRKRVRAGFDWHVNYGTLFSILSALPPRGAKK